MKWVPINRGFAKLLVKQKKQVVVANQKQRKFHPTNNIYFVHERDLLDVHFIELSEQLYTEPRNVTKLHILFYMESK